MTADGSDLPVEHLMDIPFERLEGDRYVEESCPGIDNSEVDNGVLGVTAVDGKHRVLLEACRGKHLDLAAPGTDFSAASQGNLEGYVSVRGTSFAAPLVAGLLARDFQSPDVIARDRVVAALTARAEDLGPRGRDDIYGAGLVAAGLPDASVRAASQQGQ